MNMYYENRKKNNILNVLFIIIALIVWFLIGCTCSALHGNNKKVKSTKKDCSKDDVGTNIVENNKYTFSAIYSFMMVEMPLKQANLANGNIYVAKVDN